MLSFEALRERILEAWPPDRFRLRRLLRSIEQAERQGKPFDRNLTRLADSLDQSVALRDTRRQARPRVDYSEDLPITARRQEILDALVREDSTFRARASAMFSRPAYEIPMGHDLPQRLAASLAHVGRAAALVGASFWTDAAIRSSTSPAQRKAGRPYS